MIVDVIPSLKELNPQKIYGKTVIVIDIFRCTSTIVSALANGCKEIVPVINADEAIHTLSKNNIKQSILIAGESSGKKTPEFQLGNSPFEFSKKKVNGKKIILSTTNGTVAIRNCKPAKHVLIGSFLNVSAVCSCALGYRKDIIVVCSGTRGSIALEDVMAAGCHILKLNELSLDVRLSELAKTFYYLYLHFKDNLKQLLTESRSGINLINLGFEKDIEECLQFDKYKAVPVFLNNTIKINKTIV